MPKIQGETGPLSFGTYRRRGEGGLESGAVKAKRGRTYHLTDTDRRQGLMRGPSLSDLPWYSCLYRGLGSRCWGTSIPVFGIWNQASSGAQEEMPPKSVRPCRDWKRNG